VLFLSNSNSLYKDKNWLTEQYWGFELSAPKIAKKCKTSGTTIRRWMRTYNIPRRGIGSIPFDKDKRRINHLWRLYNRNCNRSDNDKTLEINYETFKEIVTQPCYYCGKQPINGIDRLDSSKGYGLDNCVPCCSLCNQIKSKLNPIDFICQIYKIENYCSEKYGILYTIGSGVFF